MRSSEAQYVTGSTHSSLVTGLASAADCALSVGFDDTLKEISPDGKAMTFVHSIPLIALDELATDACLGVKFHQGGVDETPGSSESVGVIGRGHSLCRGVGRN